MLGSADVWLTRVPFVKPFATANGVQVSRNAVILRLTDVDGVDGWAECVADSTPYTAPESAESAFAALATDLDGILGWPGSRLRPMIAATVEGALSDLSARRQGRSLATEYGGSPGTVEVGAVIGDEPIDRTIVMVEERIRNGYRRIKLKQSGNDWSRVAAVRSAFPDAPLAVDANGSLHLDELDIAAVDRLDLVFVEQPFPAAAYDEHRRFRERSTTPVCLDESIRSLSELDEAGPDAGAIIAVKPGPLGGVARAGEVARRARELGLGVLVGGMLETGIGRGHALAFARSAPTTEPADLPGSAHYLASDLTERWVVEQGAIAVPDRPGLGQDVDLANLERLAGFHHHAPGPTSP